MSEYVKTKLRFQSPPPWNRILTDKNVDLRLLLPMPKVIAECDPNASVRRSLYAYLTGKGRNDTNTDKTGLDMIWQEMFNVSFNNNPLITENPTNEEFSAGENIFKMWNETKCTNVAEWCQQNWGSPGEAVNTEINKDTIVFQTPWSAPFLWMQELATITDFEFVFASEDFDEPVVIGHTESGTLVHEDLEDEKARSTAEMLWQ